MDEKYRIPDLKKAQENKPVWTPGGPFAKASASVRTFSPQPEPKTPRERLAEIARSRTTWFAAFLVAGGAGFAVTALRFTTAPESSGARIAGAGSTSGMKIRFARPDDPTRMITPEERERAARAREAAGGMRFDLIKDADKAAAAAKAAADAAQTAADEADPGMNYDETGASHAGGPANAGAGAAAGGDGGGQAAAGGSAGVPMPRLKSSGSFALRGMRRVSATAGFRSIQGNRGIPSRTLMGHGAGANSSGLAGGNASAGSAATVAGPGGAAGGGGTSISANDAGGDTASGSGSESGGGGGGAGDPAAKVSDPRQQIQDLMDQAASDAKAADKQKEYAEALAAGGQFPQADYHRRRYEKLKRSADQKTAEAQRLSSQLMAESMALAQEEAASAEKAPVQSR